MTYTLEVKRNKHDDIESIIITDGDNSNPLGPVVIAKINPNLLDEAEFILRACNSYAELLEALKEVTKYFGNVRFGEKGYTYDGVLIDMNEAAHKRLLEKARTAIARGEA